MVSKDRPLLLLSLEPALDDPQTNCCAWCVKMEWSQGSGQMGQKEGAEVGRAETGLPTCRQRTRSSQGDRSFQVLTPLPLQ